MLIDVCICDFPSYWDVQDILREWIWNPKSIVDTEFGIGFGEDDWTFNFHEDKDGIWYIDLYYETTEVRYSVPVACSNMTVAQACQYQHNYEKFEEKFKHNEEWR